MTPQEVYDQVVAEFGNRKYAAGLAVAFIDFLVELGVPRDGVTSLAKLFELVPRREFRSPGKQANTLIVGLPGAEKTLGLRPFYNRIDTYFRATHQRFDYPSCPGHATGVWRDYIPWLDAMCGFSAEDLAQLRQRICDFVLETLPSQAFDPSTLIREPPLFEALLDEFDLAKHRGEKTGAAYQGVVFGFLRADNPHLQVEIDKVRTGSKRLQRVGDIDAWEGARLAITAEVKQYILREPDVSKLAAFANAANTRGAIGLVCGLGFDDGVREKIADLAIHPLDLDDLRAIVSLWDPMKQRTALASMTYYVKHVEKNSALGARLDTFIAEAIRAYADTPSAQAEDGEGAPAAAPNSN